MSNEESPLNMVKIQDESKFNTTQEEVVEKPNPNQWRIDLANKTIAEIEAIENSQNKAKLKAIKEAENEFTVNTRCGNCTEFTGVALKTGTVIIGSSYICEKCGVTNKISEVQNNGLAIGIISNTKMESGNDGEDTN